MKKYICYVLALAILLCLVPVSHAQTVYQVGSQMMDFTIETHDGKTISLYETLKEKDLVLINIWASWCGPCRNEFPYMEQAYQAYSDRVEIIAVSCEPTDTNASIGEFAKELGLTFPMGKDTANLANLFQAQYIPTSVIVSKTGRVEYIESRSMTSVYEFTGLFDAFLQRKPTVARESQETLSVALNAEGMEYSFYNGSDEYAWPMIYAEVDGRKVVRNANQGVGNSYAAVYASVSANVGDVLVVEFKTSTEPMNDLMKIVIDNEVVKVFGGEHDWMTYAHPFASSGTHEVQITYVKNLTVNGGEDRIWIDTVKVVPAEEALDALSMNPDLPIHEELSVAPLGENAKKVLIFDPSGMMDLYFGEFEAYIANADAVEIAVGLTNEIDPEIAFIVSDADSVMCPIATIEPDADGFYRQTFALDSMETSGYPYTTIYLYSDQGLDPVKTVMFFVDEENTDIMMHLTTQDEENPTVWTYEEDLDAGEPDEEETEVHYTVKFVDQTGAPVPGVMAQVCTDLLCSVYVSDENGVCAFSVLPNVWEMHILMLPEGYEGDMETVWTLAPNGEDIEIVLEKK